MIMKLLNTMVDALVKGVHVRGLRSYTPALKDPWKGHPSIGARNALASLVITACICICILMGGWFALLFFVGAL